MEYSSCGIQFSASVTTGFIPKHVSRHVPLFQSVRADYKIAYPSQIAHALYIFVFHTILEGLSNVMTILSDRDTGLSDESIDVVLLYRTFYIVKDKRGLLDELHRVLKPGGILSVLGGGVQTCLKALEKDPRFSLSERSRRLLNFRNVKV